MKFTYKRLLTVAFALAAAAVILLPTASHAKKSKIPVLRMATTTSTVDSGLLDFLLPNFEKKFKVKVEVISVGTGNAIKLGESGDVDVILVHARAAEDKFVADGFGVNRRDVMHNDFLIAGPPANPAGLKKDDKGPEAFKKIADKQSIFISRGDKSGTDMKEKEIWKAAGIAPAGKWFMESGQGMGATLTMADELGACTLVDRATFISYKSKVKLTELVEGDAALFNPYGVIAVNPKKNKYVKYDLAMKFIGWLTSQEGQKLIGEYKVQGVRLFTPDAKK
ncbi:MAG: substrate-binding domain-containing protein [bacterium]